MNESVEKVWSQKEIQEKAMLESVVDNGQHTFIAVGQAITRIRDARLYLMEYSNFEDYCEGHWGWTSQRVSQIVTATELHKALPEQCKQIVTTESHARALKPVPAAERPKVVQQAAKAASTQGNGHVTARHITEAAQKVVAPKDEKQRFFDKTGWEIPENLHDLFLRVPEVMGHLQNLSAIRAMLRRVGETRDPLWLPVNTSMTAAQVDQLYAELKQAVPYAVCVGCQGWPDTMKNCTMCKGRGVLSQFVWDTAVLPELKEIRKKGTKK